MAPREPRAGDVLDSRYRLVERLGHGGFGDVWRAEELLPDGAPFREVALKLLFAGGADIVDWAEEAKLLASFRHPSLVTIYAAGILAGEVPQRFVAMELLEGTSLSDLLHSRGPVPWRRVLAWARSTAAALDLIHAAGVVHLDLKPANLFLAGDGALKVLDFGIARRAGVARVIPRSGARLGPQATARELETATGLFVAERTPSRSAEAFAETRPAGDSSRRMVIGTPGFMAPELLQLVEPTAAADAYALAVCVVQLATGHLPIDAPDEPTTWEDPTAVSAWLDAVRSATLQGTLRPLDSATMRLPHGLATLLTRLLAVDPGARGIVPGALGELFDEAWERPHGVPDPPYFGAAAYPPEGEGLLFGRDDDLARLGRELEYEPLVVLEGPAYAGKTSLAVAGLVPYLGKRGTDGKDDWVVVPIAPGQDPDAAVSAVVPGLSADLDALAEQAARSRVGLCLLLDPLEALPEGSRTAALCEVIAAGPRRPGLRLVAALREGAAAQLATSLGAALRARLRFVGPPTAAAVEEIVAGPALRAGVSVDSVELVAAEVQRELRAGCARLPYVAIALADWWRARGRADGLRGEHWRASGGVRGAVVRHAERVLGALPPAERATAEELLLRLSSTDGSPVVWDEAELLDASGEDRRPVLERLARAHLLQVSRGVVEIGHEALLREWPRLCSLRLAQMELLTFQERLREARLAWERAERHKEFLLHRGLFEEARAHARWVPPRDRAFVEASRRRVRLWAALRVALAALVMFALAGAVRGRHMVVEARRAEARTRAAAVEVSQIAELAARARRSDDPYQRTTFAAAAMERGSLDGLLPLDIADASSNLVRAELLSLDAVEGPDFPWDERFLLGLTSTTSLAVVDFNPPEPDVIEDVEVDFDPAGSTVGHIKKPVLRRLHAHVAPLVERVPFTFDTAFATRASDGEVKVFRLGRDGLAGLAAVAPMRCAGAMMVAAAAPVLACPTRRGLARWDLRRARTSPSFAVAERAFQGAVADISADGERIAAIAGAGVLLWTPSSGRAALHTAPRSVSLARFSPRDEVLALLAGKDVQIVAEGASPRVVFEIDVGREVLTQMRWDEGGLDLGLCGPTHGSWRYLKHGGRAEGDPSPRGDPCVAPRSKGQPELLRTPEGYAELAERDTGPHVLLGGFKLRRRRFLSHDLVLFDAGAALPPDAPPGTPVPPAASRLLRFDGKDEAGGEELRDEKDSVLAMERDDRAVMVGVADEVRFYSPDDGTRFFVRKGTFVRRCHDGRYLAWAVTSDGYRLFDAWSGAWMGTVPRAPGLLVGADAACTTLYTQRLDGVLVAHPIAGGASREIAAADGYVYAARPSAASEGHAGGVLIAVSSGAVARIDDDTQAVRLVAYATPRATALADGPRPGDVVFADATGVVLVRPGEPPVLLHDGSSGVEWEDISVAPGGSSMLLASGERIGVIDLMRRELLGAIPSEGKGRLSRWDDEGSVVAWSFQRVGGATGMVIPRGVSLARAVSAAVSNLTMEKGRLTIRR